jgi:long-chain acyl-CoA synthetase
MAKPSPRSMASLIESLSLWGSRRAVGLRHDLGLRWWTYAQLYREAQRVAWLLERSEVRLGDRILLWGPNSPEWVACLLGAVLRGVVVVPIDETTPRDSIIRIATETSARLVFHSAEKEAAFLNLPAYSFASLPGQPLPEENRALSEAMEPENLAAIMYTAGTTDCSRGVQLTCGNILSQLERFRNWRLLMRLHSFRMLVIAPLSHVQGLMIGAFLPLSIGAGVVFVRSPSPAHLIRTIRDNRIMILATVPRMLQMLTRSMEQRTYGKKGRTLGDRLKNETRGWMRRHILFSALNQVIGYRFWVITVGGAALSRYDEQFWRDTGRFVIHGYGLTETTAIAALNGPFSRRVGSIGKALKHVSIRIAEDGEILVRGENVTQGYFGDGFQDAAISADGYLHTGDLGRVDDGRLYFIGRKKELIVTSEGFNVAPAEIEGQLNRAPGVIDSVAIGVRRNGSEEVHAVLLLQPHADAAEAVMYANRHLAASHLIRSWTVWPGTDFPRSTLMKPRRADVAQRVEALNCNRSAGKEAPVMIIPDLEAIAAESNSKQRIELLARFISEWPSEDLRHNRTSLAGDLGLGSLDTVELLAAVERKHHNLLDHTQLPPEATIADIAAMLNGAGKGFPGLTRQAVNQPRWSATILGRLARRLVRPAVIGFWSHFYEHCVSEWKTPALELNPPFLLAAAPHRHWLDAFAICSQLPARLASRLLIVTNHDFKEYFAPQPGTRWTVRMLHALAYYLGTPLLFPFAMVPPHGSTRRGLLETAVMIDRGYCPLVFPTGIEIGKVDPYRHDRGMALLALECGVPVVPVWITGNERLGWRPSNGQPPIRVAFGPPIPADVLHSPAEIVTQLESSWISLAAESRGRVLQS